MEESTMALSTDEPWLPLKWVSASLNTENKTWVAYPDHHPCVVRVIRDDAVAIFQAWHMSARELTNGGTHAKGQYEPILTINTSDPLAIRCALLSLREFPPFTPEVKAHETVPD
jgi:hypothetical protein